MNKFKEVLNKKAFIPYILAGYPNLETSAQLILAAQRGGASLIEIGIPFSDPVALAKSLEEANLEAIKMGTNLENIFKMLETIKREINIPLIFVTYLNPLFVYGYEKFCEKCLDVGISGLIILDLPFEERIEIENFTKNSDLTLITVVAPTSYERIDIIAKKSEGFIYLLCGIEENSEDSVKRDYFQKIVTKLRETTYNPIYVNFNNAPSITKEYIKIVDGVIVEGKIMEIIEKNISNPLPEVEKFIKNAVNSL